MPVKMNAKANPSGKAKAGQLLRFAKKRAHAGCNSAELFMVIFGPQGKARHLFPTALEWAALEQTEEYDEIHRLFETATPSTTEAGHKAMKNGHLALTLLLPKSVHAALVDEAAAEGVSLDQLCLSKLVAQLRELV